MGANYNVLHLLHVLRGGLDCAGECGLGGRMVARVKECMNFVEINHCRRDLNFLPKQPWPEALPPICWRGWLLSGFESPMEKALELTGPPFHQAFQSCYLSLSFSELARLYGKAREFLPPESFCGEKLLGDYGFKSSENTFQTMIQLVQAPMAFQEWCQEKQVAPKDLGILRSLSFPLEPPMEELFDNIAHLQASKSLGVSILQLICELYLMEYDMGAPKELLFPPPPPALPSRCDASSGHAPSGHSFSQKWYELLVSRRFPRATEQGQRRAQKLKELPWPGGSEVKEARWGDLSGVEIKLRIGSQKDFKKYLHGLQHVYELLEKQSHRLW